MLDGKFAGLTRANLEAHIRQVLNIGNTRNPNVYLVEYAGQKIVVKDFAPRGAWVRRWLGPWLLHRELRAYRALAGHFAVPALLGEIDALAFAVEYRPGRHISTRLYGKVTPNFVDELTRAIDEMHARGVVHFDLRHRSNVLAGEDGHPVLIDFASALCLNPHGLVARLFLPLFVWVDRSALKKWRARLLAPSTNQNAQ